jgi:acetyl esterase/lipase
MNDRGKYGPGAIYQVKTRDVQYKSDEDDRALARIYQPHGQGPFPALIDVHGGAWNFGDRTQNELIATELAASGLVVVAFDLRVAPKHQYPAQLVDVNYATRWLKAHAGEFNADPTSVGGFGSSSGGYTVMLSAMRPQDPRYTELEGLSDVDASLSYVIILWGVIDPYARYLFAKEGGRQETVTRTEAYFPSKDVMREGNPQLLLERGERASLPPTLVIAAKGDEAVPNDIPKRFVEAYRNAGGPIEIEWFEGGHLFGQKPGPQTDRALKVIKAFVARQVAGVSDVPS